MKVIPLVPYTEKIFVFSESKVGKISTAAKENLMFGMGWGRGVGEFPNE